MHRYHSRKPPVEDCPQRDNPEIDPRNVIQSPFRGSPFALRSPAEQAAESARIARLLAEPHHER